MTYEHNYQDDDNQMRCYTGAEIRYMKDTFILWGFAGGVAATIVITALGYLLVRL